MFALDPDPAIDWLALAHAAKLLRGSLSKLGLKSFLKGTGRKSLHVAIPTTPQLE